VSFSHLASDLPSSHALHFSIYLILLAVGLSACTSFTDQHETSEDIHQLLCGVQTAFVELVLCDCIGVASFKRAWHDICIGPLRVGGGYWPIIFFHTLVEHYIGHWRRPGIAICLPLDFCLCGLFGIGVCNGRHSSFLYIDLLVKCENITVKKLPQ
jgi:hypothetical protein